MVKNKTGRFYYFKAHINLKYSSNKFASLHLWLDLLLSDELCIYKTSSSHVCYIP